MKLWTPVPDSEFDDWMEATVEVEDSETERRLCIASTWQDNSSSRLLRYLKMSSLLSTLTKKARRDFKSRCGEIRSVLKYLFNWNIFSLLLVMFSEHKIAVIADPRCLSWILIFFFSWIPDLGSHIHKFNKNENKLTFGQGRERFESIWQRIQLLLNQI